MAGNTGKMTREALADRGPRMRLMSLRGEAGEDLGYFIARDHQIPLRPSFCWNGFKRIGIHSSSYSLSYLLGIVRGWRIQP